MKALSLTQPWASLVAIGAKRIETRSWPTNYRGPIAIHASKGFPKWAQEACGEPHFFGALKREAEFRVGIGTPEYASGLPLGSIVAVGRIIGCRDAVDVSMNLESAADWAELAFGDYAEGRFAWLLSDVHRLPEPIPCKGALGLWDVPADIARQLEVRR